MFIGALCLGPCQPVKGRCRCHYNTMVLLTSALFFCVTLPPFRDQTQSSVRLPLQEDKHTCLGALALRSKHTNTPASIMYSKPQRDPSRAICTTLDSGCTRAPASAKHTDCKCPNQSIMSNDFSRRQQCRTTVMQNSSNARHSPASEGTRIICEEEASCSSCFGVKEGHPRQCLPTHQAQCQRHGCGPLCQLCLLSA